MASFVCFCMTIKTKAMKVSTKEKNIEKLTVNQLVKAVCVTLISAFIL